MPAHWDVYLFGAIGNGGHVCRDLAHLSAFLFQALVCASSVINHPTHIPVRTHLPNKLLDGLVDGIVVKVELSGDALRLVCECHAALMLGVEGTDEFDLLFRLRADTRLL
jgi:hypothetical protein